MVSFFWAKFFSMIYNKIREVSIINILYAKEKESKSHYIPEHQYIFHLNIFDKNNKAQLTK